jgi:hypothetical protein
VNSVSQVFQTYRYTDVTQYLNAIYAEQSSFSGGLFVLANNFVNQFASQFADYRIDLGVVQKLYNFYRTTVPSYTVIPEFLELLQTLPPSYNPKDPNIVNLYRSRIIDIFGTDISVSSTHGGIFYQETAIKSCYGGSVGPDMISEMDSTISKQPPGKLAYLDYRRLGVFDVKGGNPEIPAGDYAQIIASFPADPAITSFESVPLWKVAPANYQAALQAAINDYANQNQVSVNAMISSIEAQKVQSYKNPQSVYVYGRQTEQQGSIIHWTNCPFVRVGGGYYTPRCTINIQTANLNSGKVSVFINENWENEGTLTYESQRDSASGQMRLYGQFQPFKEDEKKELNSVPYTVEPRDPTVYEFVNNTFGSGDTLTNVITTPWQHTGCVSLDYLYLTSNPNYKLYFTACIDCLPIVVTSPAQHGLLDSDLQCVCPGF